MAVLRRVLSETSRKVARWYRRACVRDDLCSHGVRVPDGLWSCGDCRFVSLDALGLRRHLRLAHAR